MGYGVVSESGTGLAAVDYGTLTTTSDRPLAERLRSLYEGLVELIGRHHPTEVAVEQLFFSRNVRTALVVGQARGVALLAAANCGLSVAEYSPQQVKQAVAVYGRARKEQIQQMVQVLLGLPEIPEPDDAADALALAICHLHTTQTETLIRRSVWT
jgi:crossover junction endodeoxyribonuclease RuvC